MNFRSDGIDSVSPVDEPDSTPCVDFGAGRSCRLNAPSAVPSILSLETLVSVRKPAISLAKPLIISPSIDSTKAPRRSDSQRRVRTDRPGGTGLASSPGSPLRMLRGSSSRLKAVRVSSAFAVPAAVVAGVAPPVITGKLCSPFGYHAPVDAQECTTRTTGTPWTSHILPFRIVSIDSDVAARSSTPWVSSSRNSGNSTPRLLPSDTGSGLKPRVSLASAAAPLTDWPFFDAVK